jgi:hypothetical protein
MQSKLGSGGLSINRKNWFLLKTDSTNISLEKTPKNLKIGENQKKWLNSVILKHNGSKIMPKTCKIMKHCRSAPEAVSNGDVT